MALIYFFPCTSLFFFFVKGKVSQVTPYAILLPSVYLRGCAILFPLPKMAWCGLRKDPQGVQPPCLLHQTLNLSWQQQHTKDAHKLLDTHKLEAVWWEHAVPLSELLKISFLCSLKIVDNPKRTHRLEPPQTTPKTIGVKRVSKMTNNADCAATLCSSIWRRQSHHHFHQ